MAFRTQDDLRGEVAVVTGASRGLGLLLARELARQGCSLIICARDTGRAGPGRGATAGRRCRRGLGRLRGAGTLGQDLDPAFSRKAFDRLTALGRTAARRFNERPSQ